MTAQPFRVRVRPKASNVVTLRNGYAVHAMGTPAPEVIEMLEEYLQKARDGHVQAVALTCVNERGTTLSTWATGYAVPAQTILGGIHALAARYTQAWLFNDD